MNLPSLYYRLIRYTIDEQVNVFEHEDEEVVVQRALEVSKEDNWYSRETGLGVYNYRLEAVVCGEFAGGCRFFNNGTELTSMILESIMPKEPPILH
ncbi:hypothetical protein D3C71_1182420 [compost metagenome]